MIVSPKVFRANANNNHSPGEGRGGGGGRTPIYML